MVDLIGRQRSIGVSRPSLTTVLVCVLMARAVVPTPAIAAAEWFADVYLGVAATKRSEGSVTVSGQTTRQDVGGETSVNPGVRVGRWFETLPWLGLALDTSYFKPGGDSQTIPTSLLVMGRLGFLTGGDFPDGRLRPYAGVGPGGLNEKIAVFGEYGFSHVSPSLDSDKTDTKIEATFDSHHVVVGVSFRF